MEFFSDQSTDNLEVVRWFVIISIFDSLISIERKPDVSVKNWK